jgi:hypothetical protein
MSNQYGADSASYYVPPNPLGHQPPSPWRPTPHRRSVRPVLTGIAGLLVGAGVAAMVYGSGAVPTTTPTVTVPGPTVTVTTNAASPACLDALDKAEEIIGLGSEGLDAASDGIRAASNMDLPAMKDVSRRLNDLSPKMTIAVDEYKTLRAECKA